jgi:putative hydrolase of HD superfamily
MRYFTENEFENKIIEDNEIRIVPIIEERYNKDFFSPMDGNIIKACDKFSAFIEASLSIKHGIKSEELVKGKKNIHKDYKHKKVNGLDFGKIFEISY